MNRIQSEASMRMIVIVIVMLFFAFGPSGAGTLMKTDHSPESGTDAEILHSWQGDYPVAGLKYLPEKQRAVAVGFIGDVRTFENVWKALKPDQDVPGIDFKANLVLFARNTQFYNSIRIGNVNVKNGVAEVLAMETMSAMPIEDKVAMSLVVVARKGIRAVQTGDKNIPINQKL